MDEKKFQKFRMTEFNKLISELTDKVDDLDDKLHSDKFDDEFKAVFWNEKVILDRAIEDCRKNNILVASDELKKLNN